MDSAICSALNEIVKDNGGEFNNGLLSDLSDQLNVFIITTNPGESPWSNGITERQCDIREVA